MLEDAAGQLSENADLWEKFMAYEDRLTNVTEPPEVGDMASTKAAGSKTTDSLTEGEQNETVRELWTREHTNANYETRSNFCLMRR